MNAPLDHGRPVFPELVVIGGSAGALELVTRIVGALPSAFGIPILVVLHLPRHNPTRLPELLTQTTSRVVEEARDKQPLERGLVCVAPPDYHLLVDPGPVLAVSLDAPVNFSRPSIDVLFESAADVVGSGVLGILLSGANDDGARGLAAIAHAGGETLVQDPAEATSPAMPDAGRRSTPSARVLGSSEIIGRLRALAALEVRP